MCARGIKINENCNLDGRKIVHNRSLGSPGSSSCGRLPTTQWWVSVSLGSYVSWMVGALFIISVSAPHKAKPKSKVRLGRWGLVSVQSFVCASGIKIDENRGLEEPKIVQNRGLGGLWVAWGVFGEIWVRISRKILARVSPRWVK